MMQRLTKRLASGVADYNLPGNGKSDEVEKSVFRQTCVERPAAYEDTGCEPEEVLPKEKADEIVLNLMRLAELEGFSPYGRLRELAEADKDGRVVVLPCKIGTTTYYIHYPITVCPDKSEPEIKKGIFTLCDLDRVGYSVFLTHEEADRALEGKRNA